MKRKKDFLAVVSLAVTVVSGWICSANAGVVVSYVNAQPTTNVVVSYTPTTTSGYAWANNDSYRRDLGQSFLASGNFTMSAISYQLSQGLRVGATNAAITVKVFESTDVLLIGTCIATNSGNYLPAGLDPAPVAGGWVTFDIDDVDIASGKYYTTMLSFDEYAPLRDQGLYYLNGYDGQGFKSADGITYNRATGLDLAFVVQGTIPPPPDVTVSYSDAQPSGNVVVSYVPETTTGYAWANNDSYRRDLGQSFLSPKDFSLAAVSYQLSQGLRSGAVGAAITLKVFESSDVLSIGTLVSTQTGNYLPAGLDPAPAAGGWVTFDLIDVAITSGKYYTAMLAFDEYAPLRDQGLYYLDGYEGQGFKSADGITYARATGLDLAFVVQEVSAPEIGDVAVEYLGVNGLALTWSTGAGFNYTLWEKTDLVVDPTWSTNQSGISGGVDSVTVTTAVDAVQAFYKVTLE